MKQETKELLDYIISQFNTRQAIFDGMPEDEKAKAHIYNYRQDKIQDFLNSIPEIESKLCRGGYIQDANGIPCCDGDLIMNESIFDREKQKGVLYWSKNDSRFYCKNADGLITHLSINFTKVE